MSRTLKIKKHTSKTQWSVITVDEKGKQLGHIESFNELRLAEKCLNRILKLYRCFGVPYPEQ